MSDSPGTTTAEECDHGSSQEFILLAGVENGEIEWSSFVSDRSAHGAPALPVLDGGIVLSTYGTAAEQELVHYGADGTFRGSFSLPRAPKDITVDGEGRIAYIGTFEQAVEFGRLDGELNPLGARERLPWDLDLLGLQTRIAVASNGDVVVATSRGEGDDRWVGRLTPEGEVVWAEQWPVGSEPDSARNGGIAGVAVLADGTAAIALTAGADLENELWLEAFRPDGEHAWAVVLEDQQAIDITATADTFVLSARGSSREHVHGFDAEGTQLWSTELELTKGSVHPCSDNDFLTPSSSGFTRFSSDGASTETPVNLVDVALEQLPDYEPQFDSAEVRIQDAVCSSDGDVIVVAVVTSMRGGTGVCDSDG